MKEQDIFLAQLALFESKAEALLFFEMAQQVLKTFELDFQDERLKLSASEAGALWLSVVIGNRTVLSVRRSKKGLQLMLLLPQIQQALYQKHPLFLEISAILKPNKKNQAALLVSFDLSKFEPSKQNEIIQLWQSQITHELEIGTKAKRDVHNRAFYEAILDISQLDEIDFSPNAKRNLQREMEEDSEEEDSSDYSFDPKDVLITNELRSLDSLVSRIKYENINLNPDFQRNANLWTNKIKSRLIESILLRLPLPAFYFDASDDDEWLVVDGLQRLSVLEQFVIFAHSIHPRYQERLKLKDLTALSEYNGLDYNELPGNMKRRINEFQVTTYLIRPGTPEEVKYSIFHRINTGGIKLNPQEIRNALNQKTQAPQFLKKLAETTLFSQVVNISPKRMKDREIVLRFLAFQILDAQDYTGSISIFLDKAMKKIGAISGEELNNLEAKYMQALQLSDLLFGEHSFSKSFAKGKIQFNTPLYEVWTYYLAQLSEEGIQELESLKDDIQKDFSRLLLDSNFDSAISTAFTDTTQVNQRFKMIYQLLKKYNLDVTPWKHEDNA